MMTLDDRLNAVAQLREVLDMAEGMLAEASCAPDRKHAADELRAAIEALKAQISAWEGDVNEQLERRARIAAELAKCRPVRACRRCAAKATSRTVGNIEDLLAFIADHEPLETLLAELVPELQALCSACFGSRLRGLEQLAAETEQSDSKPRSDSE